MLAQIATRGSVPEDLDVDLTLLDDMELPIGSLWSGHRLQVRGWMRDGMQVALGLNLTECARLYVLLHGDADIRSWAAELEARAAVFEAPARVSAGH